MLGWAGSLHSCRAARHTCSHLGCHGVYCPGIQSAPLALTVLIKCLIGPFVRLLLTSSSQGHLGGCSFEVLPPGPVLALAVLPWKGCLKLPSPALDKDGRESCGLRCGEREREGRREAWLSLPLCGSLCYAPVPSCTIVSSGDFLR